MQDLGLCPNYYLQSITTARSVGSPSLPRRREPRKQLLLLDRLKQKVKTPLEQKTKDLQKQLDSMALDPQIQNELKNIEEEFSSAESDGLKD